MLTTKKLFLIFHGRFPGEKAASLFAAKSCEAFAGEGVEVVLLVPRRVGRGKEDPYTYYGVQKNFKIVYLPTLDLLWVKALQGLAFQLGFASFSVSCLFYLLFNANKNDIIYSNESFSILLASLYFPQTLYEVHDFPEHKLGFYKMLFHRVRHILATNTWKIKRIEEAFNVSHSKMLCERNAVEVKDFDILLTKKEARAKLGLPKDEKIIVYTGHLYSWKGVDMLAEAAKMLAEDTLVVFVGGTESDVKNFRSIYGNVKNIKIVGHRDHSEIPVWQKSADVLVLPNTAKEDISKYYTSPMKLFEYMASKRPVVASNIPSIAEILNNTNAVLVNPDDPADLARGIKEILKDEKQGAVLSDKAYAEVLYHSWQARAKRILNFLNKEY